MDSPLPDFATYASLVECVDNFGAGHLSAEFDFRDEPSLIVAVRDEALIPILKRFLDTWDEGAPVLPRGADWTDARCPRCGSRLLTNGERLWCSFIGGNGQSPCTYGFDGDVPATPDTPALGVPGFSARLCPRGGEKYYGTVVVIDGPAGSLRLPVWLSGLETVPEPSARELAAWDEEEQDEPWNTSTNHYESVATLRVAEAIVAAINGVSS